MNKRKTVRVAAFIGALGASAALIASAVGTTGAYFTDSRDGTMSATTGAIRIDSGDTSLNLSGLLPGEYKSDHVTYTTNGSEPEDVWLVFNQNDPAYQKLTGAKGSADAPAGGLGGYGHFAVGNNAGSDVFSSWNLQNKTDNTSGCANDLGQGGNHEIAPSYDYTNDTLCGIPSAIKVESGLAPGTTFKYTVTFGYTPKLTDVGNADGYHFENGTISLPYKLVATQSGVKPNTQYAPVG